ncbi:MAG: hypothetical protein WCA32_16455 [Chromatiaceae bacterium]
MQSALGSNLAMGRDLSRPRFDAPEAQFGMRISRNRILDGPAGIGGRPIENRYKCECLAE